MTAPASWLPADDSALTWLQSVAMWSERTGHTVGPMPDRVFVLHPLVERVDGKPVDFGRSVAYTAEGIEYTANDFDYDGPDFRRLRWADYACRKQTPLLLPGHWPGLLGALPGVWHDDYVSPPSEGTLDDEPTWRALMRLLLRHSSAGAATMGTAYFDPFWLGDPIEASIPANVVRGPLGANLELLNQPEYPLSPQNLWPDDHLWVMETGTDSWATTISGSPDLIGEILASVDLEAIRLHDLKSFDQLY